jgi:hypothetical protein
MGAVVERSPLFFRGLPGQFGLNHPPPPPPPAPPQPSDDELELERDLEYFVEPDEAMAPRTGDLES